MQYILPLLGMHYAQRSRDHYLRVALHLVGLKVKSTLQLII